MSTAYEEGYEVVASSSEVSSDDLGLGLTLGVGGSGSRPGKPPPFWLDGEDSEVATTSSSSSTLFSRAEPAASASPSTASGHVVGWPPIRTHRLNSMINHANTSFNGDFGDFVSKSYTEIGAHNKANNLRNDGGGYSTQRACPKTSMYVKVNMDGIPIGRKVDLSAHRCYQGLANALETMFRWSTTDFKFMGETRHLNLLDGSSGYVLTYEDKEGDWLLVGDIPWGFFLNSVKRLRIMRASDANGFGVFESFQKLWFDQQDEDEE